MPVIGGLHAATRHYFCPHCKNWMFTRPEGMDWTVNIRSTMLDDPEGFAPCVETWPSEKLAFAETGAAHSDETLPPDEAWEGLTKGYQEWVK